MSMLKNLKVLIVDDTSTSRLLIRDGLNEIGIQNIVHASDGEQALQIMMTQPAHLVISDYHMPKYDGLQLLQSIRAYKPTHNGPFIMLTGRGDKALLQKAAAAGVNNFLAKPFTMADLKKAIQGIFGKI